MSNIIQINCRKSLTYSIVRVEAFGDPGTPDKEDSESLWVSGSMAENEEIDIFLK